MKTISAEEVKKKYIKSIEKNVKENLFMDKFRKATEELRSKGSWDWLKKGCVKKETESTIVAA